MSQAIYEAGLQSAMLGALDADSKDKGQPLKETSFANLPFDEAVKFFKSKKIVSATQFARMDETEKRRAFTIAGNIQHYSLQKSHSLLEKAIGKGEAGQLVSERDFIKSFDEGSPLWGLTRQGNAHLETVFRNQVLGSFSEGRFQQIDDPEMKNDRPFWQYQTVGDDAVRPAHRAMDGKIFAADDPIWEEWYPPNGHRCRCTVVTMSRREFEKSNGKVETQKPIVTDKNGKPILDEAGRQVVAEPDPGWAGSPRGAKSAQAIVAQADGQFRAAGIIAAPEKAIPDEPGSNAPVISNPSGLVRKNEGKRIAEIDKYAGLKPGQAEKLLADDVHFSIEPDGITKVKPGEQLVEIPVYSQNAQQAQDLVGELAKVPGSRRLALSTQFKGRVAITRLDSRIFADPQLARTDRTANAMARSPEVILQIKTRTLNEDITAKQIAGSLQSGAEGASRFSWEITPARIRGSNLKPDKNFDFAYMNSRSVPGGKGDQVIMSKKPIKGSDWKSEKVLISRKAIALLPK